MAHEGIVYFSESHPDKWFKTRAEAEKYDNYVEIVDYVFGAGGYTKYLSEATSTRDLIMDIVKILADEYQIEKYKRSLSK